MERKNRTLEDISRTMLLENGLPKSYWAEAVNTANFVLNRCLIRPILKKTPYELFKGRNPNISFFKPFGCTCFVHNNGKDNLGKFDARSDEGIFLGYSLNSRAYRVFNKRTKIVEESIHVVFDKSNNGTLSESFADLNLNNHGIAGSDEDEDKSTGKGHERNMQETIRDTAELSQDLDTPTQGLEPQTQTPDLETPPQGLEGSFQSLDLNQENAAIPEPF